MTGEPEDKPVRWHELQVPRPGGQNGLGAFEEPQGGQPRGRK